MAQKASKYILEIAAEYSGTSDIRRLQSDLDAIGRIDSFGEASKKLEELRTQMEAARKNAQALGQAMMQGGDIKAYQKAEKEAQAAATAFAKQQQEVYASAAAMQKHGVEVGKVAEQYKKLQATAQAQGALLAARATLGVRSFSDIRAEIQSNVQAYRTLAASGKQSAAEQAAALDRLRAKNKELVESMRRPSALSSARDTLGLRSHRDVRAEIEKVRAAYNTLATSGKASMLEIAQGKVAMQRQLAALRAQTNGWKDSLIEARNQFIGFGVGVAALGKAVQMGMRFESAMADVRKTTGLSREETEALGNDLQKLSTIIPVEAEDLAKIAAIGGQLGLPTAELAQFTELTAKMAEAFGMTAEEAGNSIGKVRNVFNLTLPEIEGFGDAINRLGNTTAAKEGEILEVMLRIGGSAQQMGLAREQAAALAAAMISLGKTPETASTAINTLMNRMMTARTRTDSFKDGLERIGMSADQMAQMVSDNPQKAIDTLLQALAKFDGIERAEVLTQLFGAEYQEDIGVLVAGLQSYRNALGQVADTAAYAGSMQQEFRDRTDTAEAKVKLLTNTLKDIARSIGEGFKPVIKTLAVGLNSLLTPLADLVREFPKISAAIASFGFAAVAIKPLIISFNIAKLAVLRLSSSLNIVGAGTGTAVAGMSRLSSAASLLQGVFKRLSPVLTGFFAGWEIGTWLNQFDIVKQAGIAMAAGLHKSFLRAKQAWAWLSGGDVETIQREIERVDALYAEMFAEVGQKARGAGATVKKAHQDGAAAAKGAAETTQRVTGDALKEMQKQYKAYADEVRRLQNDISGRERSLAAELREMARSGMDSYSAWKDRKKEAEEYAAAARRAAQEAQQAMEAGDEITGKEKFAEALQYADEAKQAYKDLNTEVKDGDQVVISQADALKTAMDGVKKAGEIGIDVLKRQQQAAKKAMDTLVEKSGFADLTAGMDDVEKKWLENWQKMQAAAIKDIDAVEQRIVKMVNKDRTVYINVVERQKRALGGLIGAARLAMGGRLAGFGGGDRIPALLEAGEYVIRKEAVARFGSGIFDALNSLRLPDLSPLAAAGAGSRMVLELHLPGEGAVTATVSGDDAERLKRWNRRVSHLGARR